MRNKYFILTVLFFVLAFAKAQSIQDIIPNIEEPQKEITNIIEYAVAQNNWVDGGDNSEAGALAAGFSVIFMFLVLGLATMFNYSIASSYVSVYERDKTNNIERKKV